MLGKGAYVVLVDGELMEFGHWDEIPAEVDAIIKFLPDIPPGPHTHEQHEQLDRLTEIFHSFMQRERRHASRDQDR